MGQLVKKQTTVWVDEKGKRCKSDHPQATKKTITSKKWYANITDENGKRKSIPLSKDKGVSKTMLAKAEHDIQLRKLGIRNTITDAEEKPLEIHLEDYRGFLRDKGNSPLYVKTQISRIKTICTSCKWISLSQIQTDPLLAYLAKTQSRPDGMSPKSANHYITAFKGFCNWLVRRKRLASDPLSDASRFNTQVDIRRDRRTLSGSDLKKLFKATKESKSTIGKGPNCDYRFTGIHQYRLYLMAVYTGLRASELASLTRSSIDWEKMEVTVNAAYTKNGQTAILPIHPIIKKELKYWIDEIPQEAKLWKGSWAEKRRGAGMLKRDLQEAQIPFEVDGKRFDFHALRTQFITGLIRSGTHPKDAQTLARHSTITLTMDIYAKVSSTDPEVRTALGKMRF